VRNQADDHIILALVILFEVLPYSKELWRGLLGAPRQSR
jgi:hypothetical protein